MQHQVVLILNTLPQVGYTPSVINTCTLNDNSFVNLYIFVETLVSISLPLSFQNPLSYEINPYTCYV